MGAAARARKGVVAAEAREGVVVAAKAREGVVVAAQVREGVVVAAQAREGVVVAEKAREGVVVAAMARKGVDAARARKCVAIALLLLAPIVIHLALATQRGIVLAGILIVAEATIIAWIALSFVSARFAQRTGSAIVLILTSLVWRYSSDGVVASSGVPHALAYLSLLTVFGASLAPGRTAIITMFAERSRGALPPSLLRYTRRVTWAWCLFCAFQLIGSLLLVMFAPVSVWSTFVNTCNLPLLAAMFLGEFAWRKYRHGSAPWERLSDLFHMARRIRTASDP